MPGAPRLPSNLAPDAEERNGRVSALLARGGASHLAQARSAAPRPTELEVAALKCYHVRLGRLSKLGQRSMADQGQRAAPPQPAHPEPHALWLWASAFGAVVLSVYVATLYPGISGGDAGELVVTTCNFGGAGHSARSFGVQAGGLTHAMLVLICPLNLRFLLSGAPAWLPHLHLARSALWSPCWRGALGVAHQFTERRARCSPNGRACGIETESL